MESRAIIEVVIGACFVIFYAYYRFSKTRTDDHLPVTPRYLTAMLIYMFISVSIYAILSLAIATGFALHFLDINAFAKDIGKAFSEGNQMPSAYLIAALIMTEGLPRITKLSTVDRNLRISFQRMASLSSMAQSLSAKLRYEAFDLSEARIRTLMASFIAQGFGRRDFQLVDADETRRSQHIWTRISILWDNLAEWRHQPVFSAFLEDHEREMRAIETEHKTLLNKARFCFKLSNAASKNPELARALKDCADHYTVQLKQHLQKLADFMSRGLLTCQRGPARSATITRLGFKTELNHGLSIDNVTLMFLMLFVILICGFGVSRALPGSGPIAGHSQPTVFLLAIMIASIYSIGILFALMAKWHCDRRGKTENAWATYFAMGLAAVAAGSVVSIFVQTILRGGDLEAGFRLFIQEKWSWQLMVFTTTFVTAHLLNRRINRQAPPKGLRWQESAMMGFALFATVIIVGLLQGFPPLNYAMTGAIALAIGLTIGYWIPNWYRGAPRRNRAEIESMIQYARISS